MTAGTRKKQIISTRVNIGITPEIDYIINECAFRIGESRSGLVRLAIKERYGIRKLKPVKGPFTIYIRVNISTNGVAYVRKLAYKNKIPISSVYCAIIDKYSHGS